MVRAWIRSRSAASRSWLDALSLAGVARGHNRRNPWQPKRPVPVEAEEDPGGKSGPRAAHRKPTGLFSGESSTWLRRSRADAAKLGEYFSTHALQAGRGGDVKEGRISRGTPPAPAPPSAQMNDAARQRGGAQKGRGGEQRKDDLHGKIEGSMTASELIDICKQSGRPLTATSVVKAMKRLQELPNSSPLETRAKKEAAEMIRKHMGQSQIQQFQPWQVHQSTLSSAFSSLSSSCSSSSSFSSSSS